VDLAEIVAAEAVAEADSATEVAEVRDIATELSGTLTDKIIGGSRGGGFSRGGDRGGRGGLSTLQTFLMEH